MDVNALLSGDRGVFNFSAGPAQLPTEVLLQAREHLLSVNGTGVSVMEMPHRGLDFESIAEQAEQDLRDLLAVPDDYAVLFLHGGARLQFAMVPMNLAQGKKVAYFDTGAWSSYAIKEAALFAPVVTVASSKNDAYTTIPPQSQWQLPEEAAYVHYTDNETIHGLEFPSTPVVGDLTLVSDMSSNLLSKPLDIARYGLIYACAQKNIGPAGITIVIIRRDLLDRAVFDPTPHMLRYAVHAQSRSLYNTPATFSWYVAGLTLQWLKRQGGLPAMARLNQQKADRLYEYIDQSHLFSNRVSSQYRSRMNVVFSLPDEALTAAFLESAAQSNLLHLAGHRMVKGIRASIYNAMPMAGVNALIECMQAFEADHHR